MPNHTAPFLLTTLVLLVVAAPSRSAAQAFSESGMVSGPGLAYLPSPGSGPVAHWRAQYSRVDYLREGMRGMNIFGLEFGLSRNVGGYVRLTGEQLGTISSLAAFGIGVKGLVPVRLPLVNATGAWFETTTSDDLQASSRFPGRATRGGFAFSSGGYAFRPMLLAGAASVNGRVFPLIGAGASAALGHRFQAGVEVVRGYVAEQSIHAALDLTARILPYVAVIVAPGYLRTPDERTMTISVGLALSTADVDFIPAAAISAKDEFKLPSLDDIMKDSSEEKNQ